MINNVINQDKSLKLRTHDEEKFELNSFIPNGKTDPIRFFRRKGYDKYSSLASVPSRTFLAGRRSEFKIAPEMQIMVDASSEYGKRVDNNIELFVDTAINKPEDLANLELLPETLDTIKNMSDAGLVWIDRSVMVCHPTGAVYGEIDELLYSPETDTYYVGDTKTSSKVDKVGYWYQIAIYIQILRDLNPEKKIASTGVINWVRYKYFNWTKDTSAVFSDPVVGGVDKDHERYNAMYSIGKYLEEPVLQKQEIVKKDLEATGILELARNEIRLMDELYTNVDECRDEKFVDVVTRLLKNTPYDERPEKVKFYTEIDKVIQQQYERYEKEDE